MIVSHATLVAYTDGHILQNHETEPMLEGFTLNNLLADNSSALVTLVVVHSVDLVKTLRRHSVRFEKPQT